MFRLSQIRNLRLQAIISKEMMNAFEDAFKISSGDTEQIASIFFLFSPKYLSYYHKTCRIHHAYESDAHVRTLRKKLPTTFFGFSYIQRTIVHLPV